MAAAVESMGANGTEPTHTETSPVVLLINSTTQSLEIQSPSAIPETNHTGLPGWVPGTNTSSSTVREDPKPTTWTAPGNTTEPSFHTSFLTPTPKSSPTPFKSSRTVTSIALTPTSSTATAETGDYSGGGGSPKTKVAIAVPVTVVGVLILAALGFFFIRRRKRSTESPPYNGTDPASPGASSAILMSVHPKLSMSSPNPDTPPMRRKPVPAAAAAATARNSLARDLSLASVNNSSEADPRSEVGIARAVPIDQRFSVTEYDVHGSARPISSINHTVDYGTTGAGTPGNAQRASGRYSPDTHDDVSEVSVELGRVSHERDFDDMSSVSSIGDDHLQARPDRHNQTPRL
ncbi:hypothetical protein PDE_00072 [Penicillium oxalicum 114-2]|uniref:Mid2 domain-containing protein n=1 Tax=Penicillium oxalicum (strain 114-2 / CGMCC 5302) TaxID=933388 RepID=S7Z8Z2_PENO1|nr:hypothetical protein PDE_00072 [Penicillium oxalicum 114-2]